METVLFPAINNAQKFCSYLGHYLSEPFRQTVHSIEKLNRNVSFSTKEKIQEVAKCAFYAALTLFSSVPAASSYILGSLFGKGRLEWIQGQSAWEGKSIKIMSLNACFQDPWSPLTGGIVSPFSPIGSFDTRVAAVVDKIAKEEIDVFLGQEFDNLGAQDLFIKKMKENGFHSFVRDFGASDPIRNSSGLFIASKIPLSSVQFTPYSLEDRNGLAKWSNQGALSCNIQLDGKEIRLTSLHLNYGEGEENQKARIRQLENYIFPLLQEQNGIAIGDLNLNTKEIELKKMGFENAFEDQVSCTDEGKHRLRGKEKSGCIDCEERIDGLLFDPKKISLSNPKIFQLKEGNELLSDHYAMTAEVKILP